MHVSNYQYLGEGSDDDEPLKVCDIPLYKL